MGGQGTQDSQSRFPRANKSQRKSRKETHHPDIALLVIVCVLSLRERRFSREEKEGSLGLFQYVMQQKICLFVSLFIYCFVCNHRINNKYDFICVFRLALDVTRVLQREKCVSFVSFHHHSICCDLPEICN